MNTLKTKGHGYFRKSKAYGLVPVIALGSLVLMGTTSVSADDVTTLNPATNLTTLQTPPRADQTQLAHQAGQQSGELVSDVSNTEWDNAVTKAQEAGVTVKQSDKVTHDSLTSAQADLEKQTKAVTEATTKQEANTTAIHQAVAENKAIDQANRDEKARVDAINAKGEAETKAKNEAGQKATAIENAKNKAEAEQTNAQLQSNYDRAIAERDGVIAANTAKTEQYEAAQKVYEVQLAEYQKAEQAYQEAKQAKAAAEAKNQAIVADNAQKEADYQKAKQAYELAQAEYDKAVAAQKEAVAKNQELTADNAQKEAEYQKAKQAYELAQAEYDKEVAAQKEAVAKNQATTTDNAQKEADYQKAKQAYELAQAEYDKAVAAQKAAVAKNQEATADYEAKMAEYNRLKKEYDSAQAKYAAAKQQYEDQSSEFERVLAQAKNNPSTVNNKDKSGAWTNLKPVTINGVTIFGSGTVTDFSDISKSSGHYKVMIHDTAHTISPSNVISRISIENISPVGLTPATEGWTLPVNHWVTFPQAVTLMDGTKRDLELRATIVDGQHLRNPNELTLVNRNGAIRLIDSAADTTLTEEGIVREYRIKDSSENYLWVDVSMDIDGGQVHSVLNQNYGIVSVGGGLQYDGQKVYSHDNLGFNGYGKLSSDVGLQDELSVPDGTVTLASYTNVYHIMTKNINNFTTGMSVADFGASVNTMIVFDVPTPPTLSEPTPPTPPSDSIPELPAKPTPPTPTPSTPLVDIPELPVKPTPPTPTPSTPLVDIPELPVKPTPPTPTPSTPLVDIPELPTKPTSPVAPKPPVLDDVPPMPVEPVFVTPVVKNFTPEVYVPLVPRVIPHVQVPNRVNYETIVHPVVVIQNPSNVKDVVDMDNISTNGHLVPKGSVQAWTLTNDGLKAGRDTVTSYIMDDPFPSGFAIDREATAKANGEAWLVSYKEDGKLQLVASESTLAKLNANQEEDVTVPVAYVVGSPQNDGGTYQNTFTTTMTTPNGQYKAVSNTPVIYTPGNDPKTPRNPGGDNPTPHDNLIKPSKDVVDSEGKTINGQSVLPNSTLTYVAKQDFDQYKGMTAAKESVMKGFIYVDDYKDEAIDGHSLVVNSIKAANGDDVTNLLEMRHVLSQDTLDDKLKALIKASGISPVGEFYMWIAKDPAAFYKAYVQKGLDITYNLSFKLKQDFKKGDITNQTYQLDMGNGYYGNIVVNHLPELAVHEEVLDQDGKSIQNGTVKIGDEVTYKLEGWVIPAGRGYDLTEYKFVDQLQQTHDLYLKDSVVAKVDITLSDGTVIAKGSNLAQYTETVYNKETGHYELAFKADFLAQIPRTSEFGADAFVVVKRIKAGDVANEYTLYVNGNPVKSNKVTTHTPEAPQPVTPKAPALPSTGEQGVSILTVLGAALLSLLGYVGLRKRQQ
ncbi:SspB-related isopeptide-forming adhesin [Streptococcus dysgalactiae]|uniref:Agglutinin receptor n=1 Tax=Streptococcus dysgalactiae TaxID=1334 RepID=A0A9X9SJG7_STRDY|nr:SspB-related isopeptide-forming adhesin [Streptococcus dysgalactiae]VTS22160.1 Agglutinin receptor [Streptococcus dysgalactiae subsp. equisimilis]VTS42443.1 Agglutinin receptor [Streptococcus dysgalactiae subsp. equisimilis]VTS87702.1 Agglutinin receptor [Streptococcus dysgalactiae]